jgi:UDPglucose 6-dehydrogenase
MTVQAASSAGLDVPLLRAVDLINRDQRVLFVERLRRQLGGSLLDRRVALLGLAFKPETDDLRDAPSLTIARLLVDEGAEVVAYDPMPMARANAADLVPGLCVVATPAEAIAGADAVGIVTEWREFSELDWMSARASMRGTAIVDGRNALDAEQMRSLGFSYEGYGRPSRQSTSEDGAIAAAPDAMPAAGLPAPA